MFPETLFIEWMELKKYSECTVEKYLYYFNKLRDCGDLNQESVDLFIKKNPNLVARAFVKTYKKFLTRNEVETDLSPEEIRLIKGIDVPDIKKKKRVAKFTPINKEQVHMIEKVMESEGARLMLLVSFYSGPRADELINIRRRDLNWLEWLNDTSKDGLLTIPKGKGNKFGTVPVKQFIMVRLYNWVEGYKFKDDALIFPVNYKRWYRILVRFGKKALGRNINPHLLRHSFATSIYDETGDLNVTKELLRHEDITTTQIYAHVSARKIQEAYDKL